MRKVFSIILSFFIIFLFFLFIEFQYYWIIKGDYSLFFREDVIKNIFPHAILTLFLLLFLSIFNRKK